METYHGRPCKNCQSTLKYKVNWTCVDCHLRRSRERMKLNPEKNRASCKAYYQNNKAKSKETSKLWRLKNRGRVLERRRAWAAANAETLRAQRRAWISRNKSAALSIRRAVQSRREAAKINATPKWADLKSIQRFYDNAPRGFHVDHIVPLRGTNVCGLHVLENLQYLTAHENVSKGNNFHP